MIDLLKKTDFEIGLNLPHRSVEWFRFIKKKVSPLLVFKLKHAIELKAKEVSLMEIKDNIARG